MEATIVRWAEADVDKGTRILIQGAIMLFLREVESDEDTRRIEVEYKGREMEMTVFKKYYVAVLNEES